MEIIDWPEGLLPNSSTGLKWDPHVGGSESPLTRTRKTYGLSKPRWKQELGFTASRHGGEGLGARGAMLDALIAELDGGQVLVRLWDHWRPYPHRLREYYAQFAGESWTFGGGETFGLGERFVIPAEAEPLNEYAAAGSTSIVFNGFPPGQPVFGPGDFFGALGRPRIVLNPGAVADGDGRATVRFKPALEIDLPIGGTTTVQPTGVFQLQNADAGASAGSRRSRPSWTLTFTEWLP